MAEPERMGPKPLTGRKVLLIAVAAFGVVIAANLAMLLAATGTFPGLVVKNSYVASQGFDAKTAAQRAEASQTSGDWITAESSPTTSPRDRTIECHHCSLTLRSSSTPRGP